MSADSELRSLRRSKLGLILSEIRNCGRPTDPLADKIRFIIENALDEDDIYDIAWKEIYANWENRM